MATTPVADAGCRRSIATFEGLGDRGGANWARGLLAFVMYFERRFVEAEELAEVVLEEARSGATTGARR